MGKGKLFGKVLHCFNDDFNCVRSRSAWIFLVIFVALFKIFARLALLLWPPPNIVFLARPPAGVDVASDRREEEEEEEEGEGVGRRDVVTALARSGSGRAWIDQAISETRVATEPMEQITDSSRSETPPQPPPTPLPPPTASHSSVPYRSIRIHLNYETKWKNIDIDFRVPLDCNPDNDDSDWFVTRTCDRTMKPKVQSLKWFEIRDRIRVWNNCFRIFVLKHWSRWNKNKSNNDITWNWIESIR